MTLFLRLRLALLVLLLSLLFGFFGALLGRFFLSPWGGLLSLLLLFALSFLLLPWERLAVSFSQEDLADDTRKTLAALDHLSEIRAPLSELLRSLEDQPLPKDRLDDAHQTFLRSLQLPLDSLQHLREIFFPSHRRSQALPIILLLLVVLGSSLLVRPLTSWLSL